MPYIILHEDKNSIIYLAFHTSSVNSYLDIKYIYFWSRDLEATFKINAIPHIWIRYSTK